MIERAALMSIYRLDHPPYIVRAIVLIDIATKDAHLYHVFD